MLKERFGGLSPRQIHEACVERGILIETKAAAEKDRLRKSTATNSSAKAGNASGEWV